MDEHKTISLKKRIFLRKFKNHITLNYLYICMYKNIRMKIKAEQLNQAATMLKAIAHPLRIAIIERLDGGKRLTVTQIHQLLNIEQPTASHHLGILRDKGVLSATREGKNTFYALKYSNLSQIVGCIQSCICV